MHNDNTSNNNNNNNNHNNHNNNNNEPGARETERRHRFDLVAGVPMAGQAPRS